MKIKPIKARPFVRKRTLFAIMRTFIFLLCTTVFAFSTEKSFSQEQVVIDVDKEVSVDEIFSIIHEQTKYRFLYPQDLFINAPKIKLKKGIVKLSKLLNKSLLGKSVNFELRDNNIIVIKEKLSIRDENGSIEGMQGINIKGTVTSELGPLPGVNVIIKGTSIGTTTDFDGNYSITVTPNQMLQFSYVGYVTKEILVGDQTSINVNLLNDNELDEIVLVGYGSVKKSDLTGSVSSVDTDGFEEISQVSVNQILTGRVAGVNISQSSGQVGSGTTIRIRGGNSLNGNNEPLFVVDGYPIINDDSAFGASDALGQPNTVLGSAQDNPPGALNWLNPADIESIEVLKDASATAIYGSRGANGVIIITTKSGKREKIN